MNRSLTGAPAASQPALLAAFAAIYLIWGSTFLALRYAVEAVPPLVTIALRCVIGAAVLFAWLAMRGRLAPVTRRQWGSAALAGALLFIGGHAVLATIEQRMPSGRAALLLATIPLWLVVLEAVRTRRLPPGRVGMGLGIGLGGVALLAGGPGSGGGATLHDHLFLVGSALAWALGSLVARHGLADAPALQSTAMQLAAGGVFVVAGSIVTGETAGWSPVDVTPRAAAAVAFLVICGTVIAFAAYTWLLRVASPHAVGTYGFVNPMIALALAWAVGDEQASAITAAAAVLIVGSVMLIWRRPAPATAGAPLVSLPRHAHHTASPRVERLHDGRVVLAPEGRDEPAASAGHPDQLGNRAGRVLLRRAG